MNWADLETISSKESSIDGEDLTEDFEFFCKRLTDLIVKYKADVLKMDVALDIFALMPVQNTKLTEIYEEYLKKPLVKKGYDVNRTGDLFAGSPEDLQGSIKGFSDILNAVSTADIVIADLTGRDPNVFYILGRAHQQNKIVIQIAQNANDVPADFKQFSTIIYQDSTEGYKTLKNQIEQQITQQKAKLMGS